MIEMNAELEKKIISYGYEYTLVYRDDRKGDFEPCAFGFPNYVIKSCKKINLNESEK